MVTLHNEYCANWSEPDDEEEDAYTWACHSYCTDKGISIDLCTDRPTRGDCKKNGSHCRWNDSPNGGWWCEKNEEWSYNCEYDNKTSCDNDNFCERKSEPLCVDITNVGLVENNHSSSTFDNDIIKDESFCAWKTHTCGNSSNNNSDPRILPLQEELWYCVEDKSYYCNKIEEYKCWRTTLWKEYLNCNSQACAYCYQSQCSAQNYAFKIPCKYMAWANFKQNECESYMWCRWFSIRDWHIHINNLTM